MMKKKSAKTEAVVASPAQIAEPEPVIAPPSATGPTSAPVTEAGEAENKKMKKKQGAAANMLTGDEGLLTPAPTVMKKLFGN